MSRVANGIWLVRSTGTGMYEGALSLLSPEFVFFLRAKRETPSIDLRHGRVGVAEPAHARAAALPRTR